MHISPLLLVCDACLIRASTVTCRIQTELRPTPELCDFIFIRFNKDMGVI